MDGFREGSGLFGVAGCTGAAEHVLTGLRSMQHRGRTGMEFAFATERHLRAFRVPGLVSSFDRARLGESEATLAIGLVHGGLGHPDLPGLPLDGGDRMVLGGWSQGQLAAAVAGRFTNGTRLRRELKEKGALFQTESDAEVLLHLIAQSAQKSVVNRLVDALWKVEGAFSALLLGPDLMVAVRDPRGFRPLVVGRMDGGLIVASEDVAIREAGGTPQRAVSAGEMIVIQRGQVQSVRPFPAQRASRCVQELIGLARHDAEIFGRSPYEARVALGERLGALSRVPDAGVVLALPTDEPYALGYSRAAGIPYERAVLPGWGEPSGWMVVPAVLRGQRAVLVARSILTGEEVKGVVRKLRGAGAIEVHLRVATPPITKSCVYGVPSPTTDELASAKRPSVEELALWMEVDSVDFLPNEELGRTLGDDGWCRACLTGDHPVAPEEPDDQLPLF